MNFKKVRSGAIYILLLLALGAFLYTSLTNNAGSAARPVRIDQVAEYVRTGTARQIVIKDDRITVTIDPETKGGTPTQVQSRKESNVGLVETLLSLGVTPEQLCQHPGCAAPVLGKLEWDPVGAATAFAAGRILLFYYAPGAGGRQSGL
jgi:hypothetical protein